MVICVLVVLAWWLLRPRMGRNHGWSRQLAAQSQISAFGVALETFKMDTGFYPATQPGLSALLSNSSSYTNWKGPYLKEVSADPWGNNYVYQAPGLQHTNSFDLVSWGPDGKFNTADDLINSGQETALIQPTR